MQDQRSTTANENLQGIIDAAGSVKAATLTGQQQYSTPTLWAEFFAGQLPCDSPPTVFDPQCAGGNLLLNGWGWNMDTFGWDIDARFEAEATTVYGQRVTRLTGNCVKLWEILDDLFPELKFECQVANPPFGIRWKKPDPNVAPPVTAGADKRFETTPSPTGLPTSKPAWLNTVDSTDYTWKKILERASPKGYGYFIANAATLERLKIHEHPWVYLYQKFPKGFFHKTEVEPGVVHWERPAAGDARARLSLVYQTLDPKEHAYELDLVLPRRADRRRDRDAANGVAIRQAFEVMKEVLDEERGLRPPFNIWLDGDGMLRIYLSTRTKAKRKLTATEIQRMATIENQHPLTLTTEATTRKLLRELTDKGEGEAFYTISPDAKAAITEALAAVATLATPLMPVTSFEKVAYADELENLLCKAHALEAARGGGGAGDDLDSWCDDEPSSAGPTEGGGGPRFTPGKWYALRTATYTFVQEFTRQKVHFDEESQKTFTQTHQCSLTGQDRYISLTDDAGIEHRFMDRPATAAKLKQQRSRHVEHEETLLWEIFEAPDVRTIAEAQPEKIAANHELLRLIEGRINA